MNGPQGSFFGPCHFVGQGGNADVVGLVTILGRARRGPPCGVRVGHLVLSLLMARI